MEALATVIKGGNRLLEIKAHVVCRDINGQIRWEEDAITKVWIPFGYEIPKFSCETIHSRVVEKL